MNMKGLFGVMDECDLDTLYTYEAESLADAAKLHLEGDDSVGTVVRVFALGRHAPAYIKSGSGELLLVAGSRPVRKE